MEAIFGIIMFIMIMLNVNGDRPQNVVPLDNELNVKAMVAQWNAENPDELMQTWKSVGNHGGYGNWGLDREYLRNGKVRGFAKKKGLAVETVKGERILYVKGTRSEDFVLWVKANE